MFQLFRLTRGKIRGANHPSYQHTSVLYPSSRHQHTLSTRKVLGMVLGKVLDMDMGCKLVCKLELEHSKLVCKLVCMELVGSMDLFCSSS